MSDAASDARAGRHGLIWGAFISGPWIGGLICDAPYPARPGPALYAGHYSISDVLRAPGEPPTDQDRWNEKAGRYISPYNVAMLKQPGTPYADLCRPGPDSSSHLGDPLSHLELYDSWDGVLADRTRSLAEAARRGTVAEVRRWLARSPSPDAHDGFEVTPLAWAVLRRRPDVEQVLLDADADPLADPSGGSELITPLRVAILQKDVGATERLMKAAQRRGSVKWSPTLLQAAASTGQAELLGRMLAEPHD